MRPQRVSDSSESSDPSLAVALMDAIGSPDFAARVLAALEHRLPASHCTVFALRDDARAEAVSSASAYGEVATLTAIEYLRMGFDRKDSNMTWLARRRPARQRQIWVGHQFAREVADEEYRRLCYGDTGIRERLSLLCVFPDGYRVAVSFYRNHSYDDYRQEDADWTARQAAPIATAVMRHVRLMPAASRLGDERQRLIASLSARERELVSHVLAGRTTREAAGAMGVTLHTALTYRYRAFQHLGIRSFRELISRPGAAGPPPPG